MPVREMRFRIRVIVEKDEDVGFFAFCPDLQGVAVEGGTMEELQRNVQDAVVGYLRSLEKHNDPIPLGVLQSDETHSFLSFVCRKILEKPKLSKDGQYIQDILYCPSDNQIRYAIDDFLN